MMMMKKNNALDTKNKIRTAASVPGMFTCCFSAFCKTNNTSTADNDLVTVPDNDLLTSPDCRPLPRHYPHPTPSSRFLFCLTPSVQTSGSVYNLSKKEMEASKTGHQAQSSSSSRLMELFPASQWKPIARQAPNDLCDPCSTLRNILWNWDIINLSVRADRKSRVQATRRWPTWRGGRDFVSGTGETQWRHSHLQWRRHIDLCPFPGLGIPGGNHEHVRRKLFEYLRMRILFCFIPNICKEMGARLHYTRFLSLYVSILPL